MASSYALPSTNQAEVSVIAHHSHHDPEAHERGGSHSHSTRHAGSTHDRKEVLHGTGVAIQHGNHTHHTQNDPIGDSRNASAEIITGVLLVLPFLTASLLQVKRFVGQPHEDIRGLEGLAHLKQDILESSNLPNSFWKNIATLTEALILTSAVVLLSGLLAVLVPGRTARAKQRNDTSNSSYLSKQSGQLHYTLPTIEEAQRLTCTCAALVLSFFAALQLGGWRFGFALLVWSTSDLHTPSSSGRRSGILCYLRHQWLLALLALITGIDFLLLGSSIGNSIAMTGYVSLVLGVGLTRLYNKQAGGSQHKRPQQGRETESPGLFPSLRRSPLWTLTAGLALTALAILLSIITRASPSLSTSSIVVRTLTIGLALLALYFAKPSTLRASSAPAVIAGAALCCGGILLSDHSSSLLLFTDFVELFILTSALIAKKAIDKTLGHATVDSDTTTTRPHDLAGDVRFSAFTQFLLQRFEPDSLFYSILIEKDSRRIAYFTCLNFAFMLVQGLYGYLSGSLGLLSDTVHMFFDCLGLVVGLGAAVASKWPHSPERPFGWGKLNTLAGFGNGIFLMLVSVEFAWEAVEGMLDGRELRRVKELLVVSTLGLIINLIGLFAFGHAHAGHDHSHSHSHGHDHSHAEHAHAHNHHHESHHGVHDHDHDHDSTHHHNHNAHSHESSNGSTHSHDHNENMHGIFLHVAADAGGSLAVIISTALTLARPWYLWDPLATIIIAVLIFAAAVPLVQSSGRKLLLIIPEDKGHGVKGFLQEVAEMRGALGYAAPRFWLVDKSDEHEHKHEHEHGHDHSHDHNHDHNHGMPEKNCSHEQKPQAGLVGSVHVIAAPFADLDDIRERVQELARSRGIRATVQVEYESDAFCWCGGSQKS